MLVLVTESRQVSGKDSEAQKKTRKTIAKGKFLVAVEVAVTFR